jgi:hypothetical protein
LTLKPENRVKLTERENSLLDFRRSIYRPTPKQTVVEWCEANLKLTTRQTEHPGPFSTSVRPYTREVLECFKDSAVSDVVLCWGSQTAKTMTLMAGLSWLIDNEPSPVLWLMPTEGLARSFAKTRWMPMLEDSPAMVRHFPEDRHKLTTLEQHFDGCTLNFIGSNSPANLASRPIRILVADEVDKFAPATDKEAAALDLAMQRTKSFSSSKHFLTSTPTVTEGDIWQQFLRGDQRRYYVPCPHCREKIRLEWKQVKWETEKDEAGKTNLQKVRQTARYECQLCNGQISDAQKVAALRHGEWRAENPNAMHGVRSYHLSSLYSPDRKCTWGLLAVAFLEARESLLGLQGFINGSLAEPWENQGAPTERTEIIVSSAEAVDQKAVKFLTVDYQAKEPYFWFVVRAWDEAGNSRALDAGSLDNWQDVREKQLQHGIHDTHVCIDSGYNASTVYAECLRWGRFVNRSGKVPLFVGWIPSKGQPRRGWRDPKTKVEVPFFLNGMDPRVGSTAGGKLELKLLEFATDTTKDILERIRRGHVAQRWEVADAVATRDYWRHLDSEYKFGHMNDRTGRTTYTWKPRNAKWPNHLFDAEVMQVALAIFHNKLRTTPDNDSST